MKRISIVIAASALICTSGYSQWEIPSLTETQARIILHEIWPSYAMQSSHASGPYYDWTVSNPISVLTQKGTVKYSLLDAGRFTIALNDTMRDTLSLTIGEIIPRTQIYTGDSLRNLLLMVHSIGDTVSASVAWMPVDFLWNAKDDSVYAWVRQAVLTDIPAQYISSQHDWRALDSILIILSATSGSSLFERVTQKIAPDQIAMEPGSIFVSYNNSTQVLTYLRRKP